MHRYRADMYHEAGGGKVATPQGFLAASDNDASEKFRKRYHSDSTIKEAALVRVRGGGAIIEHYQPYM